MEAKINLIPIYIMGKQYQVPDTLTVMKAMEYAGYQLTRGCGCRGGICGACGIAYRLPNSYKIEVGLACQAMAQPNMYLAVLPFFPNKRGIHDLNQVKASVDTFKALYPEVFKCVSCNTCTKSCPMSIEVMDYINAVMRGDIVKAAELSFDCVMCGLCTSRCPAEISHANVAILARRLFASQIEPRAGHLKKQAEQVRAGKFKEGLAKLKAADTAALKELYKAREAEPDNTPDEWAPKSNDYL
jgi:heterodisulfide reductase subunit C/ferredoxin